jgi:hypothetical protein
MSCRYTWTTFAKEDQKDIILTGLCPSCFYLQFGTFIKFYENPFQS